RPLIDTRAHRRAAIVRAPSSKRMSLDLHVATPNATEVAELVTQPAKQRFGVDDVEALMALPFGDLLYEAQRIHRAHHPHNGVQLSTLLSIKTGGCPEDCAYCPQAA